MPHWCLPAITLLLSAHATAAGPPTAEEVRANARTASGFEAFQKLPEGIVCEGKAEFLGVPGTFRCRIAPDGRYVRVIEAHGEQAVGFDGTTRWGRNFSGMVRLLGSEEADRDRYLFGVLCQRWLAADGGFGVSVDRANTSEARVCLNLTHRDAGVHARLYIDRAPWRPARLEIPSATGTHVTEFSDFQEVAGVRFPGRVAIGPRAGGEWVHAERARPGGPERISPAHRP